MNTRMMFARAGNECCQCENVASANSNSQLEIGNIGIGNTSTRATLNKMFARIVAGAAMLCFGGCGNADAVNCAVFKVGDSEEAVIGRVPQES